MRPAFLNPLFASAQTLSGIGPRLIQLLRKCLALPPGVTEPRVIDVLWHMPTGVIDRRSQPRLSEAVPGLQSELGGIEHCYVQSDRRVGRGGVLARTDEGEIDASIETQLTRVREIVSSELGERAGDDA